MAANHLWRSEMECYKGMLVGCAPGTHDTALDLILKHVRPTDGVIDLGARSGAMLARLRDSGFTDLHAVDLDVSEFKLPGVPIRRIDLNNAFADHYDRKFKLVCCTDVVEHLDSPREFFKQAHRLLDDDGYLCVTLPNIAYWVGRMKFMLLGELWGFGETNYREQRHISPMTYDAMRLTMKECGLNLVDAVTAGTFAGPLNKVASAPLATLFRLVGGPRAVGETAMYLAARSAPDSDLARPLHYRSWEYEELPVEMPPSNAGRPATTQMVAGT